MSDNDDVIHVFSSEEDENEGGFTSHDFRTTEFLFGKQKSSDSTESAGSKRIRLSPDDSNNQEIGSVDGDGGSSSSGDQSSPLGLKLTKTPSFLNLLQTKLSKGKGKQDQTSSCHEKTKPRRESDSKSRPNHDKERLKAANFPASYIKIGTWERIPMHEADLIAKVYYAKHKLVWEVLDGPLKSKIEVQWSDIAAIRAFIQEGQPGILEIELEKPPVFYRETSPQPRKHTLWQHTSDFTGGQATIWRRHLVRFPAGVLDKYYQKLLEIDSRLDALSKKPYPTKASPYFDPSMFGASLSFGLRYPYSTSTRGPPFSVTPNSSLSVVDQPYMYGGGNYQFGTQMQASFDQRMNVPRNNFGFDSVTKGSDVYPPPLYGAPNAAGSCLNNMGTNLWNNSQVMGNVDSTSPFINNMNYQTEMAYHVPNGEHLMQNVAMSSNYGLDETMVSETVNWLAATQDTTNSFPPFVPVSSNPASCYAWRFHDQNV